MFRERNFLSSMWPSLNFFLFFQKKAHFADISLDYERLDYKIFKVFVRMVVSITLNTNHLKLIHYKCTHVSLISSLGVEFVLYDEHFFIEKTQ